MMLFHHFTIYDYLDWMILDIVLIFLILLYIFFDKSFAFLDNLLICFPRWRLLYLFSVLDVDISDMLLHISTRESKLSWVFRIRFVEIDLVLIGCYLNLNGLADSLRELAFNLVYFRWRISLTFSSYSVTIFDIVLEKVNLSLKFNFKVFWWHNACWLNILIYSLIFILNKWVASSKIDSFVT